MSITVYRFFISTLSLYKSALKLTDIANASAFIKSSINIFPILITFEDTGQLLCYVDKTDTK